MNKTELIEHISKRADISKAAAARALDAMCDAVRSSMRKGDSVAIVGFGTFAAEQRVARTGRNPRTGLPVKIKATRIPKFRAGRTLRDAIN